MKSKFKDLIDRLYQGVAFCNMGWHISKDEFKNLTK